MKKSGILFLFLVSIAMLMACGRDKILQKNESLANSEMQLIEVENYLYGNIYHVTSQYGNDRQLKKEQWKNLKSFEDGSGYIYGMYIDFTDSLHYRKYYTAPCGNDCFFSVYGEYKLRDSGILILMMDSTTYSGECRRPMVYGNGKEYTCHIIHTDSIMEIIPLSAQEYIRMD